jgi:hypothetical protein
MNKIPSGLLIIFSAILLFGCSQNPTPVNPQGTEESANSQAATAEIAAGNTMVNAEAKTAPEIFAALKPFTKIKFSEPAAGEFTWIIKTAGGIKDTKISGNFITATNLRAEQVKKIADFFLVNKFMANRFNAASGTDSGFNGYEKPGNGLVCLVNYTAASRISTGTINVKVSCGTLPPTLPEK